MENVVTEEYVYAVCVHDDMKYHVCTPLKILNCLGCVSLKESQLAFSNLAKSLSRENGIYKYNIALKFDWRLHISTAEPPVKFQTHPATLSMDLVASRLDEI